MSLFYLSLSSFVAPVKHPHAFFSLFQLPSVGFAILVHIASAAYHASDISMVMKSSIATKLLIFVALPVSRTSSSFLGSISLLWQPHRGPFCSSRGSHACWCFSPASLTSPTSVHLSLRPNMSIYLPDRCVQPPNVHSTLTSYRDSSTIFFSLTFGPANVKSSPCTRTLVCNRVVE